MTKRICTLSGCVATAIRHSDYCAVHHEVDGLRRSDWAKIDKHPGSECWLWTGCVGKTEGYGRVGWLGNRYDAHRYVWLRLRGGIPTGLVLDHLCRVRHCVNPDHLEVVTDQVNLARGESPSAIHSKKTRCPRGHEYDGVRIRNGKPRRICKKCDAERARRDRARSKVA